ncbi:hypothetical protein PVK06_020609 [Gossypium arboreum]|uniref:Uncharacterized protein n=1 Tax=Gossypium arboreum TaxID=29729 RepID=A0ABR0PNB8_GOSAR|nr:hypothetical protein PVK06_020609 [Gossypium arboreum]
MSTPIRLTLENFGEFLKLPPRGELNEKDPYNLALNADFKLDLATNTWVKYVHHFPQDDHNEELEEQYPLPASSSAQSSAQPLSNEMFAIILSAVTSLNETFRGFNTQVDDAFEGVNMFLV